MAAEAEEFQDLCNVLFSHQNFPVTKLNWIYITTALVGLQKVTKNETYRSQIDQDIVYKCKHILEEEFEIEFGKRCVLHTQIFRFLRNCCVSSRQNQEYIIGLLPTVLESLEKSMNHQGDDQVKQVIESGLQLLGNLVTANKSNQHIVWGSCFNIFFQTIMDCSFERAKNFTCMVIYNCARLVPRPELVTAPEGISLINSIIQMCCTSQSDVEWGIFCIESLLEHGYFFQVYESLHDYRQRIFLLNIIEERLKANEDYEDWISWMSINNVCYLAKVLEENIAMIIHSKIDLDCEETSSQIIFASHLLRLLCFVTSFPEKYIQLRNRISLLENTLVCLRETSTNENKMFFSNSNQFPSATDEHSDHPTHCFKKCLVQLVGNMCYQNKKNQDYVREMECIPLILDHCNIDDHNPYICQWAIFSLHNILENNPENQEVIKSLKKLGLATNERLLDAGFLVKETTKNKIKVETIKKS